MDEMANGVIAAREALLRAMVDIEQRLAAEPSWLALRQLDEHPAGPQTAAAPRESRSRLTAELDASVPDWRLLAGIKAAIAAVDGALAKRSRAQSGENRRTKASKARGAASARTKRSTGKRPQGLDVPHAAPPSSLIERIRSAGGASEEGDRHRLADDDAQQSAGEALSARGKSRVEPATSGSISGSHYRSVRQNSPTGDAGEPDKAGPAPMRNPSSQDEHGLARGTLRGDHPFKSAASADFGRASGDSLAARGARRRSDEEADVEIVPLGENDATDEDRASASLARRLEMARESEPEDREALEVSLQTSFDEASVEIVILDAEGGEEDRDAPPRDPVKSKG